MSDGPGFRELCSQLRREPLPVDLVAVASIDSTNRLASSIARELSRDEVGCAPTAFVAWEQTAGRGRQGRGWRSPGGAGIYVSLLFDWPDRATLPMLPLLVPLALAEAMDPFLDQPCRVDWPNDLVVDDRKLGGILLEARSREGAGAVVVAGFGLNCGPQPGAGVPVAWLDPGERGLGRVIATAIRGVWERVGRGGSLAEIVSEYAELSLHSPGDELRCRVGTRDVTGTFLGFGSAGELRLRVGDHEERIGSGEIIES